MNEWTKWYRHRYIHAHTHTHANIHSITQPLIIICNLNEMWWYGGGTKNKPTKWSEQTIRFEHFSLFHNIL